MRLIYAAVLGLVVGVIFLVDHLDPSPPPYEKRKSRTNEIAEKWCNHEAHWSQIEESMGLEIGSSAMRLWSSPEGDSAQVRLVADSELTTCWGEILWTVPPSFKGPKWARELTEARRTLRIQAKRDLE
jgi:hypothetical protein